MPNHGISSVAFALCILPIIEDPWAILIIIGQVKKYKLCWQTVKI